MRFLEMGDPYETLKKIKNMGRGKHQRYDAVEFFIAQAYFLKDVEDDYDEFASIESNYPYHQLMYGHLSLPQLRTYLTWRTKFRRDYQLAQNSYIRGQYLYLYVCELINQITNQPVEDIMTVLVNILNTKAYTHIYAIDSPLGSHQATMIEIIKSFYIIHHKKFDKKLEYYLRGFEHLIKFDWGLDMWKMYHMSDYKAVGKGDWSRLEIIEISSDYKMSTLGMYNKAKADQKNEMAQCVQYVLTKLIRPFEKNGVNFKTLFYSRPLKPMRLFEGLIFDRKLEDSPERTMVRLNDFHRAIKLKNDWHFMGFCIDEKKVIVGYILKYIEIFIRKEREYKQKLSEPKLQDIKYRFLKATQGQKNEYADVPTWKHRVIRILESPNFVPLIEKYVADFYQCEQRNKRNEAPPLEIKIDLSQLEQIRADNLHIAEKLADMEMDADEELEIEMPQLETNLIVQTEPVVQVVVVEEDTLGGFAGFVQLLSAEEKTALAQLLAGTDVSLSLLDLENINEKALQVIGDNVLEMGVGGARIYEDYVAELAAVLK